jgi:hypothetical protein
MEMRYLSRLLSGAALLALLAPAELRAQDVVRMLGEVRVRGEAERPAGFDSIDAFTVLRSRIGLEAVLSPRAVVLLQVQDARMFGEAPSLTSGRAERLDMHQAWLQYRADAGALGVSARAGRQEVSLGNERLVGASNWTNTGRAFDGLRVTFGPASERWTLHTLAANVRERSRRLTGVQSADADHLFLGGYLVAGPADVFVLHDREAAFRSFTGVDRTTVGTRLHRSVGAHLDGSLEGAYQFGNQVQLTALQTQDIAAWLLGARVGYATPLAALPRLGAGLDWLSGDADPSDGTYRAFNTLYSTGHKWHGYIDLFVDPAARTRDRGLINGIASARVALPRDVALDVDVHGFWLEQQFAGSTDRFLGWELDLTMPIRLGPGQQLQLGYSAFRNGAAAPLIGLGADGRLWHWAYIQAAFSFGRVPPVL